MNDTVTYYCLTCVAYDRPDDYLPGEAIELPYRDAAPLLALGAISPDAPGAPPAGDTVPAEGSVEAIMEAINALSPTSETFWNKDGRPAVAAIERVLGYDISVADRDAAWDVYQERAPG